MLTSQVFDDLRLIANWVFTSFFPSIWGVMTSTILAFVLITWVIGNIIKFFKRFL